MSAEHKFFWGSATAAYQIEGAVNEGGRGPSIWDTFSLKPNKVFNNHTGAVAADSYHKFLEDVATMKSMGLNSYRFSISWSRIYPHGYGGKPCKAGIEHYSKVIDALLAAHIEPFPTLYHWDLPQGLQDRYGGWLDPRIEVDFRDYAGTCFAAYGDRVKKWVTINEPWSIAYQGYGTGSHAPGRCSNRMKCAEGDSATESYIVGHNLLNAHAAAAELYHQKYQPTQHGEIGIVLNLDWGEPLHSNIQDYCAAVKHNEFQLAWFADPVFWGRYPARMIAELGSSDTGGRLPVFTPAQQQRLVGSVDFLGLNHYSTRYYTPSYGPPRVDPSAGDLGISGWGPDQHTVSSKYNQHGDLIGPQADSEWLNTVPWGFFDVLLYVHNRYSIAYKLRQHPHAAALLLSADHLSRRPCEKTCTCFLPLDFVNMLSSATDPANVTGTSASTGTNPTATAFVAHAVSEFSASPDLLAALAGPSDEAHSGGGDNSNKKNLLYSSLAVPIYVTENGCDAPGESEMTIQEALRDQFRIDYLSEYLGQMQRAIEWGVDIKGYFVWSLLDNFEWADGYNKRFGLLYVDYSSPQRTRYAKDSAQWYAKYIQTAQANEIQQRSASVGASLRVATSGGLISSGAISTGMVLLVMVIVLLVFRRGFK